MRTADSGGAESQLKKARVEASRLCFKCLEHQESCARVLAGRISALAVKYRSQNGHMDVSGLAQELLKVLRNEGLFRSVFEVPCRLWCTEDDRQIARPPEGFEYADSTTSAVSASIQNLFRASAELSPFQDRSVDDQMKLVTASVSRAAGSLPGSEYRAVCDTECRVAQSQVQCVWCSKSAACERQITFLFGNNGSNVCRWCKKDARPFHDDIYSQADVFNVQDAIAQQQNVSFDQLDFFAIAKGLVRQVHEQRPAYRNLYMVEHLGILTLKKLGADGVEHSSYGAFALLKKEEPLGQEVPKAIIKCIMSQTLDANLKTQLVEKAKEQLSKDWITPVLLDIGRKHAMAKR